MDLIGPASTGLGHWQVQRWGLPSGWVISARLSHPALVSEEDFIAVQGIRVPRESTDPDHRFLLAEAEVRKLRHCRESCTSGVPAVHPG